jgi:hypothetical protein
MSNFISFAIFMLVFCLLFLAEGRVDNNFKLRSYLVVLPIYREYRFR